MVGLALATVIAVSLLVTIRLVLLFLPRRNTNAAGAEPAFL